MCKVSKDEKNWMIIRITDSELKDAFLAKCEKADLTISNDDETDNGIEHAEVGHCISVGTSTKFHINWARNIDYYAKRAIVPVYDISLDWHKIVKRLEGYISNQGVGEVELEGGDTYKVTKDSIELNDELLIPKHEVQTLLELKAMKGSFKWDEDDDSLTITDCDGVDYFVTGKELDTMAKALNLN